VEAAQDRWRAVNGPHLVALVRAGAFVAALIQAQRLDDGPLASRGTPARRVARPRRRVSCSIALAEPWSRWPLPTCTGGACGVARSPLTHS
jgi:hypothetical protein